jgi:hypothetical protein
MQEFYKAVDLRRQQMISALTCTDLTKDQAKRIMREFEIDEISAVDKPAQRGAEMAIMKRDVSPEARKAAIADALAALREDWEDTKAVLEEEKRLREEAERKRSKPERKETMYADEVAKARSAGLSGTAAMQKARRENPAAFEKYRRQDIKATNRPQRLTKSADEATFDARVSLIQKSEKISRQMAMIKARREYPSEFAKAYPGLAQHAR